MSEILKSTWHGCYDDSWKGLITPESFSHPAKYSRGLIERIFDHLLAKGYVKKGDLVADCFGGVALGGIVAAYRGLRWTGVELEPRFVELAKANIERHRYKLGVMGKPIPQILQGDSRHFAELVAGVSAAVTSPPWEQSGVTDHEGQTDALKHGKFKGGGDKFLSNYTYGTTPGQIGSLKSGTVQAVCTSPPYAIAELASGGGKIRKEKRILTKMDGYGQTPGQIASLSEGKVASVVTSPPYSERHAYPDEARNIALVTKLKANNSNIGGTTIHQPTGESPGNISGESSENYWSAMKQVYASVWQSLKPNGILVVVIKDYCRAGKRVPLCDDTLTLLTHLAFVPLERIRAMLVKETREQGLNGEEFVSKTERKSFFRRLHEAKMPEDDERRINWEEVLIVRK